MRRTILLMVALAMLGAAAALPAGGHPYTDARLGQGAIADLSPWDVIYEDGSEGSGSEGSGSGGSGDFIGASVFASTDTTLPWGSSWTYVCAQVWTFGVIVVSEPLPAEPESEASSIWPEPTPTATGEPRPSDPVYTDDWGCGEIAVTIDPLLQTATVQGTIPSTAYDAANGEFVDSTITIDLTWDARSLPTATATQHVAPGPSPAAYADAFLSRDARADGTVTSEKVGTASGPSSRAELFEALFVFAG